MFNKSFINIIFGFVCGILFGYATCAYFYDKDTSKNKRKNSSNNLVSKDLFQYEINRLHSLLNSIEKQLTVNNKSYRSNNKNDEDETDFNQEFFYDTSEILPEHNGYNNKKKQHDDFEEVDQMFEDESNDRQYIYNYLKQKFSIYENNPEFLWRLSKAAHFLSKIPIFQSNQNKDLRKNLLHESFQHAAKALELDDQNANCHKWYAISIGSLSEFVTIKEKTQNGIKFKEHLDIALSLKNDDPTLYHLAGRFCIELLSISWVERKIASVLNGGNLPTVTYQEALQYFYKAYDLKPQWKENILFIVQTLIQIKQEKKAHEYLLKGLSLTLNSDETQIHEKLVQIKNSKFY